MSSACIVRSLTVPLARARARSPRSIRRRRRRFRRRTESTHEQDGIHEPRDRAADARSDEVHPPVVELPRDERGTEVPRRVEGASRERTDGENTDDHEKSDEEAADTR